MIIDCFIFFNEYDLLEGRLEYLYDTVDYFAIIEADVTFTGKPKPLYFSQNLERYRKYLSKILYFPYSIDTSKYNFDDKITQVDYDSPHWKIESEQRNSINRVLKLFNGEDIAIISDVDEIPSKVGLAKAIAELASRPAVVLEQDMFAFNLNQKQFRPWPGSVVTKCQVSLDTSPQHCRDSRWNQMPIIEEGGWHLTYWGGLEQIQTKLNNFSHQEMNKPEFNNPDNILESINTGRDLFKRNLPYNKVDIDTIPEDFLKVFEKFAVNK